MKQVLIILVALISFTALSAQSYEFSRTIVTICEEPAGGYDVFDQSAYNDEIANKILKAINGKELSKAGGDILVMEKMPLDQLKKIAFERLKNPNDRKLIVLGVEAEDIEAMTAAEIQQAFDEIDSPENKEILGFSGNGFYISIRFSKGGFYISGLFHTQAGSCMRFYTTDLRSCSSQPLTLMLNNGTVIDILNDWGLVKIKCNDQLYLLGKFHYFAGQMEVQLFKGSQAKYLHTRDIKR